MTEGCAALSQESAAGVRYCQDAEKQRDVPTLCDVCSSAEGGDDALETQPEETCADDAEPATGQDGCACCRAPA